MEEIVNTNGAEIGGISYPRLLMRDIQERKAEFFGGLFLSILTGAGTAWLQYREGLLDERHLWDGVITTAVPVLGLVLLFGVVEVCRAAILIHRRQARQIAEQSAQLDLERQRDHTAAPPAINVAYSSQYKTYVSEYTEEEYHELEEHVTFRNVGSELVRKVTVDTFTILGREHAIPVVPTLVPGDPATERRINLDNLRRANIVLKAFHKMPVGVPIMIRYYGASDNPQHSALHAIVYDRGTIRIEPVIGGDLSEFQDASNAPPPQEDDE